VKTTIEIPDALFRRAKLKAAESGTTLREVVVGALAASLNGSIGYDSPASAASRVEDRAPRHSVTDSSGWPLLSRASGNEPVVTDEFVNQLREEEGI